jgi:AGCS family alanine or glycine:cation symporter
MTALVLIINFDRIEFGGSWIMLSIDAYAATLGEFAADFLGASVLCFGVSTIICWAHYGMTCMGYLTRGRGKQASETAYILLLAASLVMGAVTAPTLAWMLADGAIALMTVLNLLILLLMQKEVAEETDRLFFRHEKPKNCIACEGKTIRKE